MAEDIAPALLETIRADFTRRLGGRQRATQLLELIEGGTGTYQTVNDYSKQVGKALSEAFHANLSSAVLPDGRMYYNIADRVIRPLLEDDHALVSAAAYQVQQTLNDAAGIGLAAQSAPLNESRVQGFLDRLSSELNYDDVDWILGEPVINFSQSVVDESIRLNVEAQGGAGLRPRVVRRAEPNCCKWCSSLEGSYDYPNVPRDVYRRHENCHCDVTYDPGSGKRRQDVWKKTWSESADVLQARREYTGLDLSPMQNNE